MIEKLGEGAFGQVYKVIHLQSGRAYALKEFKTLTGRQRERIDDLVLKEVAILKELKDDSHIVEIKDFFKQSLS